MRGLPPAAAPTSAAPRCATAFASLRPGGTLLLVAHDTTNLTEGIGGPQYPEVLMTAEEVLGDLDGERFEVERAERVAREVAQPDGDTRTAYDALVRVVRGRNPT